MTRLAAVTVLAVGLLLALTAQLPAEPMDPLRVALVTSGATQIGAIRYSGIGATFGAAGGHAPTSAWVRTPLNRFDADVDYRTATVRVRLTHVPPPDRSGLTVAAAPGGSAGDLEPDAGGIPQAWLTPHGFLKAARRHKARVRAVGGETEVSFWYRGQQVVGFLDERYQVGRVQTWQADPHGEPVLIETRYSDYEWMAGGGRFPRHITRTQGSHLTLDLWVWAARANPPALAKPS